MKGSHKFIVAVVGCIAAVYLGYKGYAAYRLSGVELVPIKPGRVNIVAVSPAAGYRIIVASQVAYLGKVEGGFEAGQMESSSESASSKSRLPLRELLQTLQGDEKALGTLIMRLNDWQDLDVLKGTVVWKAEDITKAFEGDPELSKKLQSDLNVTLDGNPLDSINVKAIMEGIVIDSPVEIEVNVAGRPRLMTGRVQEVFQSTFARRVFDRIKERPPGGSLTEFLRGVYEEEAKEVIESDKQEDLRSALNGRIDKERLQYLTEKPKQVLSNTVVLLNESHVTAASFESYEVGQGVEACDVSVGVTDAGRMRLWKYSHENKGFQLLFIVDSVAIAAPKITTDLAESSVTIRRVPSKDLVSDAVDLLNEIILEKK